jgi:hypothetical protein
LDRFTVLQERLGAALAANRPASGVEHVVIALPSFSVGESLLSHYADRIPSLEHRYLVAQLVPNRIDSCRMVFISSRHPGQEVLDYYASLGPPDRREAAREAFHVLVVPDESGRSVAAKLLDRPDLLDELRRLVGDRPALIEPWNVTDAEVAVAEAIGVPINGTSPELRSIGFKSEGRRLFRAAAVPVPHGFEDLRSPDDIVEAASRIRSDRPEARSAVLKLDDSGSGDGNVVLDLHDPDLASVVHALPEWYLSDLASGGVLEERISGTAFTSPSAQIDVLPDGDVRVLATHEQVLGGEDDQIYLGCRFPADPAYAPDLARHARATGRALAARGVIGRAAIDFAVARDRNGRWHVHALEINLRKGGTTHPYTTLRSLVPGDYDPERGQWIAHDGMARAYSATDNLVDPRWTGLAPSTVIRAISAAGLAFDSQTGTGVVLHMLSGLAIDGRAGLTAIAHDPTEAAALHEAATRAITAAAVEPPDDVGVSRGS